MIPSTDLFLISINSVGERHDRMRGCSGLFWRMLAGVELVKKKGQNQVRFFTNINRVNRDQVKPLSELARELKVSIYFQPTLVHAGYNDEMILGDHEMRDAFREITALKRSGYPIANGSHHLRLISTGRRSNCYFPEMHILLDWEGTLYSCDLGPECKVKWGNVRELGLGELFADHSFKYATRKMRNCNACRNGCFELGSQRWYRALAGRAKEKLIYEILGQ